MTIKNNDTKMTNAERNACKMVAATDSKPHSQRANALLAVDSGMSEAKAAAQSKLTPNQVKYWLSRFRSRREKIFPDVLLKKPQRSKAKARATPPAKTKQKKDGRLETAVSPTASKIKTDMKKGQNRKRRATMSKTAGQQVESTNRPEGKTYGYQSPQATEHTNAPSVAAKKQHLIGAFEQFVDALADDCRTDSGATPPPSTGGSYSGHSDTQTSVPPSSGGQGTSGPEAPSFESRPTDESVASTIGVLRENFKLDRAREMAKTSEASAESPVGITKEHSDQIIANKHMSDSNNAPLQDSQEFAPSYGEHPRSEVSSMEVMARQSGISGRPETVPSPPIVSGPPLDAHWASFGTAVERAQERAKITAKKADETKILELIIGTDDRVKVTANEVYPWRCICSLLITAQNGTVYIGTGWLVSPRVLLTAGHCVYLHDDGGWASQIEVIPGRSSAARPYGSVISRDLRSARGWTVDRDRDYDYGAILLPEERRYGDELGWLGFASRTDDHFSDITLNLSGYPGDGGPTGEQGTQWWNSRGVKEVNDKQITYEIDTWGGQSGSPVWEYTSEGHRYGLAIHTWGTTVSNGATRITREVFDNIVLWTSEAP